MERCARVGRQVLVVVEAVLRLGNYEDTRRCLGAVDSRRALWAAQQWRGPISFNMGGMFRLPMEFSIRPPRACVWV